MLISKTTGYLTGYVFRVNDPCLEF